MIYTERLAMQSLSCVRCGAKPVIQWCDTTAIDDPEAQYQPGRSLCPTPGCVNERGYRDVPLHRCRICGRPPGDVHSARCCDIVLAKAHDPHIVALEDCR